MTEAFFETKNSSGTAKVFYQTWGDPSGRPLVCVHGLTGSSADFKFVGEYFGSRGYYVVAIDMPGRGQSDFLKNPYDYNYNQYITDLKLFLAHLNFSAVDWLGVSMGGLLGIRLAGEPNSPIQRMIMNDIGPDVPQIGLDLIKGYLSLSPVFSTLDDVIGAFKQSVNGPFYRGDLSEPLWKYYAETHVRQLPDGGYVRSFDPAIDKVFQTSPIGDDDLWQYWRQITQPVLTLRGELSLLFTEAIERQMQLSKSGQPLTSIRFANCGHVPSLYVEEQIKLLENWLSETPISAE